MPTHEVVVEVLVCTIREQLLLRSQAVFGIGEILFFVLGQAKFVGLLIGSRVLIKAQVQLLQSTTLLVSQAVSVENLGVFLDAVDCYLQRLVIVLPELCVFLSDVHF